MATEAFRKKASRQLTELQEGTGPDTITFPIDLSSEDRKYIHHLCLQLKLKSRSYGNGANRQLSVWRVGAGGGSGQKGKAGGGKGKSGGESCGISTASTGSSAATFTPSRGMPMRLKPDLAMDARFKRPPMCPAQWLLTSPVDLQKLKSIGKGSKGGKGTAKSASAPSRKSFDASEASKLQRNPNYSKIQADRRQLPSWSQMDEIIQKLASNRVVLVAGETGCGKSTQVPQFIIDSVPNAQVAVTQPRRIAATSLAQRVSEERCEDVGETVGYAIHMDSKTSRNTRCTYCTTGVFRRWLLSDSSMSSLTHIVLDEVHERELHSDFVLIVIKQLLQECTDLKLVMMSATLQLEVFQRFFPGCATVTIPGRTFPVHELYLDEVVSTLWKTPEFRPLLGPAFAAAGHIQDEKEFKRQVGQKELHPDRVCGFAAGLQDKMTREKISDGLEKHDVLQQGKGTTFDIPIIDALILHLDRDYKQRVKTNPGLDCGAILVFFPGWGDIDLAKKRLRESLDPNRFLVLPCHSQVRPEEQRKIFKRPPPGVRKIILASNIAETSITIDDVGFVIDTGRAKETSYDPYLKVGTLATVFISKASAAQRAGRAGRTKDGICFHLFSRKRHGSMEDFREPELLRSPLEDVCLHTAHLLAQRKACGKAVWNIEKFLSKAPQAPEGVSVKNAVELLQTLGTLTSEGQISNLGVQLAALPLPVTIARSVVWAVLLGCLDPILIIVAATAGRDPFQLPQPKGKGKGDGKGKGSSSWRALNLQLRKLKVELCKPIDSDHYALLRAMERYEEEKKRGGERAANEFCQKFSINHRQLQDVARVRDRMTGELKRQKLLSDEILGFGNRNAKDPGIIIAAIAAGVFPNLAVRRKDHKKEKLEVSGGRVEAQCHPASVLDNGGGGGDKGGGKGNLSRNVEWLCYTEMTQVEQRYSISGVSPVSPLSLLLFCGDEPLEIQGNGSDVSVSLLKGWVEFQMPRDQVTRIQNLRYSLRVAFLAYCETPWSYKKHVADLDFAVRLTKATSPATPASALDPSYRPRVAAYIAKQQPTSQTGAHQPAAIAVSMPAVQQAPVPPGGELNYANNLIQRLYGSVPSGCRHLEWQYEFDQTNGHRATMTIYHDSSQYSGEWKKDKKEAQRNAAHVGIKALLAWELEQHGGSSAEVVEEAEEEEQEEPEQEEQDMVDDAVPEPVDEEEPPVLESWEEDNQNEEDAPEDAEEDQQKDDAAPFGNPHCHSGEQCKGSAIDDIYEDAANPGHYYCASCFEDNEEEGELEGVDGLDVEDVAMQVDVADQLEVVDWHSIAQEGEEESRSTKVMEENETSVEAGEVVGLEEAEEANESQEVEEVEEDAGEVCWDPYGAEEMADQADVAEVVTPPAWQDPAPLGSFVSKAPQTRVRASRRGEVKNPSRTPSWLEAKPPPVEGGGDSEADALLAAAEAAGCLDEAHEFVDGSAPPSMLFWTEETIGMMGDGEVAAKRRKIR